MQNFQASELSTMIKGTMIWGDYQKSFHLKDEKNAPKNEDDLVES